MSTAAQLFANHANAQLSTGPTTEAGKATSSRNALKTGLTGRTVLLPSDDAALYEKHLAEFAKRLSPQGEEELALVQSLADTEWRLLRIPSLEMGIYAVGRLELAPLYANEEPAVRAQLIEAKILLTYGRNLSNLSLQEVRLRRQRDKDAAALKELQAARKKETAKRLTAAATAYLAAAAENKQNIFDPTQFGFEFSLEQIKLRAVELDGNPFADSDRQFAAKAAGRRAA